MSILTEPAPRMMASGLPATCAGAEGISVRAQNEPAAIELPRRPAWVEIDLKQLQTNFALINQDKPAALQVVAVVKDDGYGHGALPVARAALEAGASFLALSTLEEA